MDYLDLEHLMVAHASIMALSNEPPQLIRAGGENLLRSALTRPKNLAIYEQADFFLQATVLCVGISQAQAFLDGNKRTAVAVLETFLSFNGYRLPHNSLIIKEWLEGIASVNGKERTTLQDQFQNWLSKNVISL